ncbi:uncharacterized protein UMAG_01333 [Mycosarcoma maydis]|uniref:VPS37 C-terminal domain-containing protein n=1 Tax=Mycosarcoma maydis TaxID=5270 RepID=A0A0D1E641_MYCMD|nr:uncharacterized protein UMAG_01333 [Ustilago maydis 521]KIS71434.1 hypothetical protein UMAG_01333 [Ustilago maydis 521]|eukprot:XP_011387239.1 hypothetical protein UMAG_01333 [Ustilago maydis 521]
MTESPASSSLQTRLTTTFPQTASLSRQDLEALACDDYPASTLQQQQQQQQQQTESITPNQAYFEAFIHSLPQTQSLYRAHADLLRTNEAKASRNLERQAPLESLRSETQQLFDRAKALEAEWATKELQLNEAQKRFNPSALHFHLTQSASQLNDRSEQLANAFVEGLPYPRDDSGTAEEELVDEASFVRRYKQQRLLYHKRRFVADRWARNQVHWTD